jgi:hypothetical protein
MAAVVAALPPRDRAAALLAAAAERAAWMAGPDPVRPEPKDQAVAYGPCF